MVIQKMTTCTSEITPEAHLYTCPVMVVNFTHFWQVRRQFYSRRLYSSWPLLEVELILTHLTSLKPNLKYLATHPMDSCKLSIV